MAKINLFRIVQESVSNIIKHSKAQNARVVANQNDSTININIMDDGIGFDIISMNKKQSLGLISMKERANLIDADFKMLSGRSGTKIEIRFNNG